MKVMPARLDHFWSLFMRLSASMTIVCTALVFLFVFREAMPMMAGTDVEMLLTEVWRPVSPKQEHYGLLPLLNGSLLVTGIAALTCFPGSILTATYIAFIAKAAESRTLKFVIELLASIPSVVIGFIGLMVLVPLVKDVLGLPSGLNALTGGLILGLMASPTVVTLAEDALKAVPDEYRDVSRALGVSEVATIFRILLPVASRGITAACLLGLGRIMGETMAVLMVTGNSPVLTLSPLEPVRTMTATIAAEMGEVIFGSLHYHALFVIGAFLLTITFIINLLAQSLAGGKIGGHSARL